MGLYHSPRVVTANLLLSIDMANIKSYPNTGITITNLAATNTNSIMTLVDSSYYTVANGTVQFTRTTAPTAKDGGGINSNQLTNALSSQNFLYNDHTWEVWARIDDRNPGNYDGTEGDSVLSVYLGYHAGFMYTASNMRYYLWNNASGVIPVSWTLGASGAQINQGSWFQIAVTKSGNVFTPYVNGVNLGTGSTTSITYQAGITGNVIGIGKSYDRAAGTATYIFYSKSTFSHMRMYNRALSATEIKQNFDANRGRFGL